MHEYFEYLFSDDYLAKGYDNINESSENDLYINEEYEFMNIRFDDILPLMYVTEDMSYEDAVLLESAYIQQTKHLNEFMGSGQHLYRDQIGVGATDWIPKATVGLSGPLKWLAALIAGTLGGLFALLRALLKKGQQAIGVALLKRYITRIAALTDEGYKNMCKLWTSRKNRACFKTFQEASERDMIVSVDVCAKALGLYDNTLNYPEDKNPYWQSEEMISDIHKDYLKDVKVSRGFFGFNKLIDKPQEKIDNTNDYAEKYKVTVRHSPTKMSQSNHQKESWAQFDYSSYLALNEYKDEEEHYGHTEHYSKTYDAYLVAARVAWENLCKRLIGDIRIGSTVDYENINKDVQFNIDSGNGKSKNIRTQSLRNYILNHNPKDIDNNDVKAITTWIIDFLEECGIVKWVGSKKNAFISNFNYTNQHPYSNWWTKLKNKSQGIIDQSILKATGESEKDRLNTILDLVIQLIGKDNQQLLGLNESMNYNNLLAEASTTGVISFRDEDLDNNLIMQMADWIQQVPQTNWKITRDFKQKCTELAAAVDNEIITKINRWTVPSGAPGVKQSPNKGYNSPITKAGLEKLWKAYKEELNNRIEQRVDNFITGKPFNYALQFLQFTIPTLFKDLLNKVDPEDRDRSHENQEVTFDYDILTSEIGPQISGFQFGDDTVETEFDNFELGDDLLDINISNLNESYLYFKGYKLNEALLDPDDMPDDSDTDENNDSGNEESSSESDNLDSDNNTSSNEETSSQDDENKTENNNEVSEPEQEEENKKEEKDWTNKINGYTLLYAFIPRDDVKSCTEEMSNLIVSERNSTLMLPNKNILLRDSYSPAQFNSKLALGTGMLNVYQQLSCYENSPKFIISWNLEENNGHIWDGKSEMKELGKNKSLNLNEFFAEIKKTLNPENGTGEKTTNINAKNLFDDYAIVALPIFWFGQMMIKPAHGRINPDNVVLNLNNNVLSSLVNYINNVHELERGINGVYWPLTMEQVRHICSIDKAKNESTEEIYDDNLALYEAGFFSNLKSKVKNFGQKLSSIGKDDDSVLDWDDSADNDPWDDLDGFSGNLHDMWDDDLNGIYVGSAYYNTYYSMNSELSGKYILVLDDAFNSFNIKENTNPRFFINLTVNPSGKNAVEIADIAEYINGDEVRDYDSFKEPGYFADVVNYANGDKINNDCPLTFVLGSKSVKPHILISFDSIAKYYIHNFNLILEKQNTDPDSLKNNVYVYMELFTDDDEIKFSVKNVLGPENNKYKKNPVKPNQIVVKDKNAQSSGHIFR